jgi:predicted TIM-barrel fold metal-dependent hydrolase
VANDKPEAFALVQGLNSSTRRHSVTFLPEPERRPRYVPIISVDDHVVEPAHLFEHRMPKHLQDRAPHVVELPEGVQEWVYEDVHQSNMGISAVVGRPIEECSSDPGRFEEMRRGTWDPQHRVMDMDINGIYASLNFPSGLSGFAGQRLQIGHDPELALAVIRAWNDWYMEEWVTPYPDRFIACQIPWLMDPEVAAAEIRRNAERGFTAVTFTEGPHELGLPSLHTGYWEPFIQACDETGTVICLHVGSSSTIPTTAPDAPFDTVGTLFFGYAMFFAVDWLFSMIPVKHPNLKICLSEGGIGWVPALLDRLDHTLRYNSIYGTWQGIDPTPAEVLQRNFYFCAIDDATGFRVVDRIGVDHVMVEADYPHLDSLWPDTQEVIHTQVQHLSDDIIQQICWGTASKLFRHPVPLSIQQNPDLFALSAV